MQCVVYCYVYTVNALMLLVKICNMNGVFTVLLGVEELHVQNSVYSLPKVT